MDVADAAGRFDDAEPGVIDAFGAHDYFAGLVPRQHGLELGNPAEHAEALDTEPALCRVVIHESDGCKVELRIREQVANQEGTPPPGAVDEHLSVEAALTQQVVVEAIDGNAGADEKRGQHQAIDEKHDPREPFEAKQKQYDYNRGGNADGYASQDRGQFGGAEASPYLAVLACRPEPRDLANQNERQGAAEIGQEVREVLALKPDRVGRVVREAGERGVEQYLERSVPIADLGQHQPCGCRVRLDMRTLDVTEHDAQRRQCNRIEAETDSDVAGVHATDAEGDEAPGRRQSVMDEVLTDARRSPVRSGDGRCGRVPRRSGCGRP